MGIFKRRKRSENHNSLQPVAGNGLLDRRALLGRGIAFAGAMSAGGAASMTGAAAEPLRDDSWSLEAGDVLAPYQQPSKFEKKVARILSNPKGEPRTQHARTPHHLLNGAITPNGLHFTISHQGNPDIDPDKHKLVIHGMVKQPLVFTLDTLARYPMVTRAAFVECGGNSALLFSKEAVQTDVQNLHGLVSCAEWTGVKLSVLFEEAGIDKAAKWMIAEGADAPALSRSVPVKKALDDAMIALYQNGERLMPGNGYPMRLLLPGYEGNTQVKYLRRLKIVNQPGMSYYEARTYSPVLPNGKAYRFFFLQEIKSFITHPSPGLTLKEPGHYEISGIAYSGAGKITKVMVSADGGKSWAKAALQTPVVSKAFTRFRMAWRWNGAPAVLQSRAWDDAGNTQPTRAEIVATRGETKTVPRVGGFPSQHYNGITSWGIAGNGEVKHVYT
jgi:sulfane dehydrogenase subunit SoxC